MLAERADEVPALLPTPRILKQLIHNTLLRLTTPLPLSTRNLHESLVYSLDGKRLRLPQSEALLFLRLKRDVSRISVLVVDALERPGIQSTDLLQGFGYCGATEAEL